MPKWVERWYLRRAIRKEWKAQTKGLDKETKMEIFKSKEQWANGLTVIGSTVAMLNSADIAAWFGLVATAAEKGSLDVVLTAVVAAVIGTSRFFSRINRKKEVEEAALL